MVRLDAPPSGFVYVPDFLSEAEERALLADFEALTFAEVRMRGVVAKRTTLHFGVLYGYQERTVTPGPPIPGAWRYLLERIAPLMQVPPEDIAELLLSRYPPGAGIGWHRDAPMFGESVGGISLASSCRFKFRRRLGERSFEVFEQLLQPRSAYVIEGAARRDYQHSIPDTEALRYSMTFRTLRRKP